MATRREGTFALKQRQYSVGPTAQDVEFVTKGSRNSLWKFYIGLTVLYQKNLLKWEKR